jgi:hypothetical protein
MPLAGQWGAKIRSAGVQKKFCVPYLYLGV